MSNEMTWKDYVILTEQELNEVEPIPFPTQKVQPPNPPPMGGQVLDMHPYQQAKQLTAKRMQMQQNMDPFTHAYVEAALWSSSDDDGTPLDQDKGIDDISDETFMTMIRDCHAFETKYANLLSEIDDEQAGHDFWLTREHHGAGFWDRGYPDNIGELLTNAAHSFGEFSLYIGDDGKIYA